MALCALLTVSAPAQGATTKAGLSKACAAKDGTLRLLAKRAKCRKGEKAISLWIGGAPAGAKGDTGTAGEPGAAGPAGATGASGSPDTDQQVLAKLLGVDGSGSGLDADLLDGLSASAFQRGGRPRRAPPARSSPGSGRTAT